MADIISNAPRLSLAERDRRWAKTRALMAEHNVDVLLVPGLRGRESYESYLSNESIQGIVVLPADRDPIYLTWSAFRIVGRTDPQNDRKYWIDDIRSGLLGPLVANALSELGALTGRIGVVGLNSINPMELEGFVPYAVWDHVLKAAPKAEFVELSLPFGLMVLAKGPEELAVARHTAQIGELMSQAILDVARPGIRDSDLFAAIVDVGYRAGITLTPPSVIVKTGKDSVSWGPPEWGYSDEPPRTILAGDLVTCELMPTYAGIETQQQMQVAMGKITPQQRKLADLARAAYDIGLETIKPGISFTELNAAMAKPVLEAGCWHLSPMIHSVGPALLLGSLHGGALAHLGNEFPWFKELPPAQDGVLEEGMLFSFEPNACIGRERVNIGGTVAVGANGPEELNSLPNQLHELDI
jgi:Xaa-Pro aminopeptidase